MPSHRASCPGCPTVVACMVGGSPPAHIFEHCTIEFGRISRIGECSGRSAWLSTTPAWPSTTEAWLSTSQAWPSTTQACPRFAQSVKDRADDHANILGTASFEFSWRSPAFKSEGGTGQTATAFWTYAHLATKCRVKQLPVKEPPAVVRRLLPHVRTRGRVATKFFCRASWDIELTALRKP